jgi:hypothetical protein
MPIYYDGGSGVSGTSSMGGHRDAGAEQVKNIYSSAADVAANVTNSSSQVRRRARAMASHPQARHRVWRRVVW